MHSDKEANSPGSDVASAVYCVISHAVDQKAVHLLYVFSA